MVATRHKIPDQPEDSTAVVTEVPTVPSAVPTTTDITSEALSAIAADVVAQEGAANNDAPAAIPINSSESTSAAVPASALEQSGADVEGEDPLNAKGPGGGPAKKMRRSKKEFTWLSVIGGPCHSERQVLSGIDLNDVKRKYKLMKCSVCEMYNPSTPWAIPRPRKYEYDTFADHEKSVHHVKAVANQELSDPSAVAVPIVIDHAAAMVAFKAMNGSLGKDSDSENEDGLKRATVPIGDGTASSGVDVNGVPAVIENNGISVVDISMKRRRKRSRKDMMSVPKIPTTKGLLKPALMQPKRVATKGSLRPSWLLTDGELRLSDKQISDPQLQDAKKKYKNVMCSVCQEFNPASHWAQWKARKFESLLLLEHERSAVHVKAVELQQAAHSMGANQVAVGISEIKANPAAVPTDHPQAAAIPAMVSGASLPVASGVSTMPMDVSSTYQMNVITNDAAAAGMTS